MIYNITTKQTYATIAEAAAATGINASSISRASRGLRRTAGWQEWAVVTGTGRQLGASKRAATMRAKKAAEERAAAAEAKAAAKAAKAAAKEAERRQKAAERAQRKEVREQKKAYNSAKRQMQEVNRRLRDPNIDARERHILEILVRGLSDNPKIDPTQYEGLDKKVLDEISSHLKKTLEHIDDGDDDIDIDKLSLIFGVSPEKAKQMQYEFRELLASFGDVKQFLLSTYGEDKYKEADLKGAYQDVIRLGDNMTSKDIMDLVLKLRKQILDNNAKESEQIMSVYDEWRGELTRGKSKKQQRKPIKAKR